MNKACEYYVLYELQAANMDVLTDPLMQLPSQALPNSRFTNNALPSHPTPLSKETALPINWRPNLRLCLQTFKLKFPKVTFKQNFTQMSDSDGGKVRHPNNQFLFPFEMVLAPLSVREPLLSGLCDRGIKIAICHQCEDVSRARGRNQRGQKWNTAHRNIWNESFEENKHFYISARKIGSSTTETAKRPKRMHVQQFSVSGLRLKSFAKIACAQTDNVVLLFWLLMPVRE